MARFIVTGGAGFIGSNLVQRLLAMGDEVAVVDNLHTGNEKNLLFANGAKGFELIDASCEKMLPIDGKIDGIYHLGIYSSSPMYKEHPELMAAAGAGFVNIMELARKHSCKVVFASTSSLYNGQLPPHCEDMEVLPLDFYTEVRLFMERLSYVYSSMYGIESAGMRFFSVYGPHEEAKGKYANLVSQFIWSIAKDEAPVVFGDGLQSRDFTYVSDIVDACMIAMENKGLTGPVNAGTGKIANMLETIALINAAMGKNIAPKLVPNTIKNYVAHTQADISKISKFGYSPKVDLKSGIKKCVEYYCRK
jgi:UDP-glucose 4-epimerase